jgi:Tat protein secretion system quality control protein TatD with DNase activity
MLVDSHCHLDFPDFAAERDAIVIRAREQGVGRLVTISTKVHKFPEIQASLTRITMYSARSARIRTTRIKSRIYRLPTS